MLVVKGDDYTDSDSDDDDVDRYEFLPRKPAPVEGDRDAGSANDDDGDDGDETADEGEPGGGVVGRKTRPLRDIFDDDAPPPPPQKKARVELIAPPPSGSETESDSAPFPCDGRAGESGSDGSHEKAHGRHRAPGRGGEANKKRGACGKRARAPGCEEDGDRDSRRLVTAAAKTSAAASGRFLCNLCDRCFDSHQALGGHVLGHRKKAKIAIAIAAAAGLDNVDDADGIIVGNCKEEAAVVEVNEETANSGSQADKMAVAAARRGKANGHGGGCDKKIKTVDDVAEHHEDVDRAGHEDDANGNAGFGNKGNAIAVPSHGFTNGNSRSSGKTGIGAAIPNQKVVAGTCHEGANGDGIVSTTLYKCKVCGTECLTGRALGGHMRKHRKRPPTGDGEGRPASPATDDDCQIPLSRLFRAETVQRENQIGLI